MARHPCSAHRKTKDLKRAFIYETHKKLGKFKYCYGFEDLAFSDVIDHAVSAESEN